RNPPPALLQALREAHARGARIASICSGAIMLAAAGLLDGREATIHWMYADEFAQRFPKVRVDPTVLYIDHGDVLTSAGTGSAIDLCLHVLRRDLGAAVANEVARRMVVPPHREGGQAQYARPVSRGENGAVLTPVLEWTQLNLARPLSVARMAARAN